jgi:hypothetical protein
MALSAMVVVDSVDKLFCVTGYLPDGAAYKMAGGESGDADARV